MSGRDEETKERRKMKFGPPPINLGSWFAKPGTTENERTIRPGSIVGGSGRRIFANQHLKNIVLVKANSTRFGFGSVSVGFRLNRTWMREREKFKRSVVGVENILFLMQSKKERRKKEGIE